MSSMEPTLSKEQKSEITASLRRYFTENLDHELTEMQAGFLLEYILKEIAPLAYNEGVEDAQKYFITATEGLPGSCFQEPMTYWKAHGGSRDVRRKPKG